MPERFPIAELRARTGSPPATIHHYLRQGLLPAPARDRANRFLYDERHVRRLRLIRILRRRRKLSLADLRRVLPELEGLGEEHAFRPEMWDRVVGRRLSGARRREPRARLLAAAGESFARRSYAEVGVEAICRAAGVAKGSFYRHFRSKEEVFFAAAEVAAEETLTAFRRAVGTARVSEGRAARALAPILEPRLPVFLDLMARALQRRPGYRSAARRVLGGLAAGLGGHLALRSDRDRAAAGGRVLHRAMARVTAEVVRSPEASPSSVSGS